MSTMGQIQGCDFSVVGNKHGAQSFCLAILIMQASVQSDLNTLPQFLCLFGARVSDSRPGMAAALHSFLTRI